MKKYLIRIIYHVDQVKREWPVNLLFTFPLFQLIIPGMDFYPSSLVPIYDTAVVSAIAMSLSLWSVIGSHVSHCYAPSVHDLEINQNCHVVRCYHASCLLFHDSVIIQNCHAILTCLCHALHDCPSHLHALLWHVIT